MSLGLIIFLIVVLPVLVLVALLACALWTLVALVNEVRL
jgi:hypothetical protein